MQFKRLSDYRTCHYCYFNHENSFQGRLAEIVILIQNLDPLPIPQTGNYIVVSACERIILSYPFFYKVDKMTTEKYFL